MAKKRIEEIDNEISTVDDLQGNELFIVSAEDANSANGYSTKKMGIQALRNYVRNGSDPQNTAFVKIVEVPFQTNT